MEFIDMSKNLWNHWAGPKKPIVVEEPPEEPKFKRST